MELSTERVNGMGIGCIPLSKIWMYLDRFDLPDWWEPVLLQSDASLIASSNKDTQSGTEARPTSNPQRAKIRS